MVIGWRFDWSDLMRKASRANINWKWAAHCNKLQWTLFSISLIHSNCSLYLMIFEYIVFFFLGVWFLFHSKSYQNLLVLFCNDAAINLFDKSQSYNEEKLHFFRTLKRSANKNYRVCFDSISADRRTNRKLFSDYKTIINILYASSPIIGSDGV